MKTRHFFNILVSAFIISLIMSSCEKENFSSLTKDMSNEYVEVTLNCEGELLDMGQTPLSRSESDNLYYVQIFKIDEANKDNPYQPYIHGLFDHNPSNLTIELQSSKSYLFIVTMVENGKHIIYNENAYYYAPFGCNLTNTLTEAVDFPIFEEGYYASYTGWADVCNEKGEYIGRYDTPILTRYFGYKEYVAKKNDTLHINMLKMTFGMNIITEGFNDKDIISVNVQGAPSVNLWANSQTQEPVIYSFFDLLYAYSLCMEGTLYHETLSVSVQLYDTVNETWHPIAMEPVTFYRNMKTTIKIRKGSNQMENSGINIDIKEPQFMEDPEEDIFNYSNR